MIKAVIVTEGYKYTGYGHITRCTAIAKAFQQLNNVDVSFILNGDKPALTLLADYNTVVLNWLEEEEQLIERLSACDIVVVDSYLAAETIYESIAETVGTCLFLDDFNRIDYPPGIIVNGTVGTEILTYPSQAKSDLLLGRKYVLLRPPFPDMPPRTFFKERIETILITFGGTDLLGLSQIVLPILTVAYPDVKKYVILGSSFSEANKIELLGDEQTVFFRNVTAEEMGKLMAEADVAVSAAGQTINELGRTGLPTVIFKVAANQENNIKGWIESGFITTYIDATQPWSVDKLLDALAALETADIREKRSLLGQSVIDGKGAIRVGRAAVSSHCIKKMRIAKATDADLIPLFHLANDQEVRKQSFSTNPITLQEHSNWFLSVLKNTNRLLFVFFVCDSFVGQVRMDIADAKAVVSISLQAEYRGLGLASEMLRLALSELKKERIEVELVCAYVKEDNIASQKLFLKAGFLSCDCEKEKTLKYYYSL